ncbi:hypothetical protein [Tenacibaculum jejuense]|uniref:Uncharacterized protein n=1 Tax=Tenacibaculum jejuense TaxID=584609 RepID=A0A238U640_9FLAO|nr:hypothetical protein [Tenacibaculum jejuense]SNR13954.1 protein of unknown function [Tenacibaculum jejuense]
MDYKSKIKEIEDEVHQMMENRKKWSPKKKQEIEAKELEITKRVKEKLDENNIPKRSIFSYLYENRLLKDGTTKKTVLITSMSEPKFGKKQTVISDLETLEMLYVQTDVTRFMDIEDYFTPRK